MQCWFTANHTHMYVCSSGASHLHQATILITFQLRIRLAMKQHWFDSHLIFIRLGFVVSILIVPVFVLVSAEALYEV